MSDERSALSVVLLSAVGTRVNPYLGLLRDGLAAAGAHVRLVDHLAHVEEAGLTPQNWGAGRPDVIHVHWLDRYDLPLPIVFPRLVPSGHSNLLRRGLRRGLETACNLRAVYQWRRWQRLRSLLAGLNAFRERGGGVVYTVHNLEPHEGPATADAWGMAALVRMADAVHVHDGATAGAVAARFGRREGVVVIPHGHYLNSYPNTIGRAEARARLALPADAFVYVSLGMLRPYKGLEELLPAFRALPAAPTQPDPGAVLVLAGQPIEPGYAEMLAALAAGDERIRLLPRFVPPEDVQLYLNAADICVLPYRQTTTSGAALLAFSFGLPVIAPAIGAFPDLVAEPARAGQSPAASSTIPQTRTWRCERPWPKPAAAIGAAGREALMQWMAQFDWGEIGRQFVEVYRLILSDKPARR